MESKQKKYTSMESKRMLYVSKWNISCVSTLVYRLA